MNLVNNKCVLTLTILFIATFYSTHSFAAKLFEKTGSGNNFKIVCSLQRLGEVGQMDQKVFGQTYLPNYHFSYPYDGSSKYCFFEFIDDNSNAPEANFSCAATRGSTRPAGFTQDSSMYSISESGITYKCFVNDNGNTKIKKLFDTLQRKGGSITKEDIQGMGFAVEFK